ncbi:MAG: solute carrier family 23 protein [Candidatus Carbobacillus sp.]|nr:solute carrier family 23 protein [Candidatus Carbobacillus sp.]
MSEMGKRMAPSLSAPIYDIDEVPPLVRWIPLSLQHAFAMFGATVLVPLLTGLDVQAALLSSGVGTLLFLLITRGELPNYLGSSFAFIGPIITVSQAKGVGVALLGAFLSGFVYVLVSWIVARVGIGWLDRLMPPLVIGSIITVIGLALSGVAVNWALTDPLTGDYGLQAVEVAAVTLLVVVFMSMYVRGFLSVIPVLSGMVLGTVYAYVRYRVWFTTPLGGGPAAVEAIGDAPWFLSPQAFYTQHMHTGAVLQAMSQPENWIYALVIVPVAFVTLAEHIGHLLVTGNVMGKNLMPKLHRSLLGDGVAVSTAALIGGPPSTTYGENIGVLAITRVFSRYVLALAAIFAILFAFVEKIGVFLMYIPKPVLGGVTIVLFGIIAGQGLRMFVEHRIDFSHKRNMLLAAIILVTGIGGFKLEFHDLSLHQILINLTIDNIAMATFLGMIVHAILPGKAYAYGRIDEQQER